MQFALPIWYQIGGIIAILTAIGFISDPAGFTTTVWDMILAGQDVILNGIGLLIGLIALTFDFISTVLNALPEIIEWLLFFITNFWLVFALIEIGIMGISMSKITFMEKISELFRLHYVVYGMIVRIFVGMIKMFISVLQAIGNYIPFT